MSWWRNLLGISKRAPALPEGTEMSDGIVMVSVGGSAPRRGTRELMVAYREQPWLRAVAGRIARSIASVEWSVYVRVEERSARARGEKHTFETRKRRGPKGEYSDVVAASVPRFKWGEEFAVRDARLVHGTPEARAARRVELAREGLLREVVDHPLLDLLAMPNGLMTGRSTVQMTQLWIDLKGEAFWLISRDGDGTPTGLIALPPHWVTAVPTRERPTFRVAFQSLQLEVVPENMVWLRDPDPENPYSRGTGVAESLSDELETDELIAKYVKNWFYNGGLPSAVVAFEGVSSPEALKRMEAKWEQKHRGVANAHRVHIGAGKMNAVKLDTSFKDQQLSELRKTERDTIAQVFNVPPEMVGIIENSNRSTIDAAMYIYALGVEFPRCEFLRAELQVKFVPMFDDTICLEFEVLVPDDANRRLNVLKSMPGAFSLNEWRGEAGYDPLPEFEGKFPALNMPGQTGDAGTSDGEKPNDTPAEDPAEPPSEES